MPNPTVNDYDVRMIDVDANLTATYRVKAVGPTHAGCAARRKMAEAASSPDPDRDRFKVLSVTPVSPGPVYDAARFASLTLTDQELAMEFATHMIAHSAFFIIEPWPDDQWRCYAKDEAAMKKFRDAIDSGADGTHICT
jgi:hypothetical protein